MQTTIDGIVYSIIDSEKMTARVGTGQEINGNAINGTIKSSILFKEFVEIENKKYKVTEIGMLAFRGNKAIKSLIIHKRIKKIEDRSFDQCNISLK